jgi:hypothetical protein
MIALNALAASRLQLSSGASKSPTNVNSAPSLHASPLSLDIRLNWKIVVRAFPVVKRRRQS